MPKSYTKRETFFILCLFNFLVLSESNHDLDPVPIFGRLKKREDNDYQMCFEKFEIHTDKIIRTQDSTNMGAKYINERDLNSREDCLRLCCETENCNVFVFEEKSRGSCYMFDCGTPEDFKCKFTRHVNYTSAVLSYRHLTDLETQIKFTQHENELTKLRVPAERLDPPVQPKPLSSLTTKAPKNQEVLQLDVEHPPSSPVTKGNSCSRYQFECRTSGECIAIYNACDGIPQCADGSDEAADGCPTTTSATPLKVEAQVAVTPPQGKNPDMAKTTEQHNIDQSERMAAELMGQKQYPIPQPYIGDGGGMVGGYGGGQPNPGPGGVNSRANYGREGEAMINYHSDQQWPYQYRQPQGGSQIFTHKGNGLVTQVERYPQHQYLPQEVPQRAMGQYPEQIPSDYSKYYYENMPYRMYPQNPGPYNGGPPHKIHEIGGGPIEDGGMSHLENLPVANIPGQDYFYEEGRSKGSGNRVSQHPTPELKVSVGKEEPTVDENKYKTEQKKEDAIVSSTSTTTEKPKVEGHVAHRKVDKLTVESKTKEEPVDVEELDGHSARPSGAILTLTIGLCLSFVMLFYVGCRMRVIRRRMRRGGKSPYAHDADFLVNGMYL